MFDFDDWSRWGFCDFEEGTANDEELKAAIASGKPFDTGFHGFRKTEYSMRIQRTETATIVSVYSCMDSALEEWDLFCDFLNNDELERLTDEMVDQIREYLYMGDYQEEITEDEMLPVNAGLEEIIKAAGMLADCIDERLKESYHECIADTLYVMYGDSEETMKRIEERIKIHG